MRASSDEDPRQRFVDAAMGLVERDGAERLTARRLATALEVAPSAVYAHFDGLDDLIAACRTGFERRLMADLTVRVRAPGMGFADLMAAYCEWLMERPNVFALMFNPAIGATISPMPLHGAISQLTRESAGMPAGGPASASPDSDRALALVAWAVHGRMLLGTVYPSAQTDQSIAADVRFIVETILSSERTPP